MSWASLSVEQRASALRPLAARIADRRRDIVALLHAENGKPRAEAMAMEVLTSVRMVSWSCEHAPAILAPRTLPLPLAPHRRARVHRRPFGRVLVISPWNFPFYIPLSQVMAALLAGNRVTLKPSELTPRAGDLIAELLGDLLPEGTLEVVQGDGAVGAALVAARPDKVCFTGSVATGRRVMAACSAFPVPVTLELGGIDALIVRADADLELAASAVAWGGTFNGGQACCSVERLLVHHEVMEPLLERVRAKLGRIGLETDLGPAIDQRQLAVWQAHLQDARERGLTVQGGEDIGPRRVSPALVSGPGTAESVAWTQESFGPIVAALAFQDDAEARRLHNATQHGLTASVFTRDLRAGEELACSLRAGAVAVNEVAATVYGHPELPWGGVGESGFGRSHGPEGLLENTWAQVLDLPRVAAEPKPMWSYPYSDEQEEAFGALAGVLARPGLRSAGKAGARLLRALSRRPRL